VGSIKTLSVKPRERDG